ncbi:hypothetical protein A3C28_00620 [Candidatus Roizmanbacteria bacterium RIFCSPHIGHO2_02_FULL_39_9]|uniref:DNA alkylation repair protein n=2 Tax=Candidatus Roizmaniibacteriota TaxID=1752723 RepID=A0A1F7I2N9_9BACT|nr:MAG: hypothetical protein A3C28_00620 [Candidatus Roizmanbacteria bacterium RIFCSPHIGHO2_02_FULL_39_9]OGK37650.1 MAG: hypothetical protein A3F60_01105 [Candidatus Roizmanbacteria bacterium RIFCSPHIGHO2_12_FULL_39_8]
MNISHLQILNELKKYPPRPAKHNAKNYIGSGSIQYHVSNPIKWKIASEWKKKNKNISYEEFKALLYSLNEGKSHDEKSFVGRLLQLFPQYRNLILPKDLDMWLENVRGWAEVDGLCQNNFTYQDFFQDWKLWEKMIRSFSKDKNVHKRRASLVLLTGPVNYSPDKRLSALSFEMIEQLKHEKDILIIKAISWLLRSLIKHHKSQVAAYLKKNKDSLPKIALREASYKLVFGVKRKLA